VRVITVLVIACPHALGLAIPLVVSIATERAARGGVLIKDRLALERMRTVDAVLFDKTGTLTRASGGGRRHRRRRAHRGRGPCAGRGRGGRQ
jgi:Cu2+-exporting ATPase